ncbi:MAG TPA: response regulator [Cyclobacteriaceae bacterium]|nr:response regulator [Cyclobacteriaceae bacterium]
MTDSVGKLHKVMVVGVLSIGHEMTRSLWDIAEVDEVYNVSSAEEAINLYAELKPDLIFIDVIQEGMSGIEAGKLIREQYARTRTVLVSETFDVEFLVAARDAGMNGYMVRCLDPMVLQCVIREVEVGWFSAFMV